MKISIGLTIDEKKEFISNSIYEIENEINNYLKERKYGDDILTYSINLIIVETPIGFEDLHKVFKPKYIDYTEITNPFTKRKIEVIKEFIVSVKIGTKFYHKLDISNEQENKKIITKEISNSLCSLDVLPKKIKSFDKELFITELRYFITNNY